MVARSDIVADDVAGNMLERSLPEPGWSISMSMEDVVALGDIQQLFDSLPPEQARVEISIASDGPAIRTQRIIEKLISAEREEPQRATSAASV
jgi:hypothetical protein